MSSRVAGAGALVAAVAVGAGAFGAHALSGRLATHELELWQTASRYLAYAGLGGLALGIAERGRGGAVAVLSGGLLFALTLGALALGGPRWLGALTPLGGAAMILGFTFSAVALWRGGSSSES